MSVKRQTPSERSRRWPAGDGLFMDFVVSDNVRNSLPDKTGAAPTGRPPGPTTSEGTGRQTQANHPGQYATTWPAMLDKHVGPLVRGAVSSWTNVLGIIFIGGCLAITFGWVWNHEVKTWSEVPHLLRKLLVWAGAVVVVSLVVAVVNKLRSWLAWERP